MERIVKRRAIEGLPRDIKVDISAILQTVRRNPEGFTIKLNGQPVTSGFVVSLYKNRETIIFSKKLNEETLNDFILKNLDLLEQENHYLGGWLNKENNKFYLDVSIVVDDLETAIGIGAYSKQIAVFALNKLEEIRTIRVNLYPTLLLTIFQERGGQSWKVSKSYL